MGRIKDKLAKSLMMDPILNRMDRREDAIVAAPGSHKSDSDSPRRFHIMREAMKRGSFHSNRLKSPDMIFSLLGIFTSFRGLKNNPSNPKREISSEELQEFESFLLEQGVSSVGYTRVPARLVFADKAIMYKNAIVTTMEMNKEKIATAPEPPAGHAAVEIYHLQGKAMNRGAEFLRKRGYAAHAGHPLMGLALYPPLAEAAGLGNLGISGLHITPEHGPRVRLAVIFTDIENLPFNYGDNPHSWILDYCAECQICVKKCPQQAIYESPKHHESGRITCVDNEKCFPFFMSSNGCAVCIKVCPFNDTPYETIRAEYRSKVSLG